MSCLEAHICRLFQIAYEGDFYVIVEFEKKVLKTGF